MVVCNQEFKININKPDHNIFSISCHGNYIDFSKDDKEEPKIFKFKLPNNIRIVTYANFGQKLLCNKKFQYFICNINDPKLNNRFDIFPNKLFSYENCYFPDLVLSGASPSFKSGISHCTTNCVIYSLDGLNQSCIYQGHKEKVYNKFINQTNNLLNDCGCILLSEALEKIEEYYRIKLGLQADQDGKILKYIDDYFMNDNKIEIRLLCCLDKLYFTNLYNRITPIYINYRSILHIYRTNLIENQNITENLNSEKYNDNNNFIIAIDGFKKEEFPQTYTLTYNSQDVCILKFDLPFPGEVNNYQNDIIPFNFVQFLNSFFISEKNPILSVNKISSFSKNLPSDLIQKLEKLNIIFNQYDTLQTTLKRSRTIGGKLNLKSLKNKKNIVKSKFFKSKDKTILK